MYVRVNVLHKCAAHLFCKHKTRKMKKIQNRSVVIKGKNHCITSKRFTLKSESKRKLNFL